MGNAYRILAGKHGKRPFRRPRHGWEVDIRMVLGKQGGKVWNGSIWLWIETDGRML
jgi:hypothetical protein